MVAPVSNTIALLALTSLLVGRAPVAAQVPYPPAKYVPYLYDASMRYNVPYPLLCALIEQESNWDATLVTREPDGTTSYGLAQANSKYLFYYSCKFGLIDPRNAKQSIYFAARYLRHLYYGNWYVANIYYKQGRNNKAPSASTIQAVSYIIRRAGL